MKIEVNPKDTTREEAFQMWMTSPMPMVTLTKTFDVSRLLKASKKLGVKFNALLCWCIGKAATQIEEFYLLPDKGKLYKDNVERAMFFARGSLETVKKLRWVPEIVHCQGFMSSLAPYLLKLAYYEEPSFRESKIIYTPTTDLPEAPLPKNFNGILAYREANRTALSTLGELSQLEDLNRIGMFMSDGVILNEPNERYERMAREMGKPIVVLSPEDMVSTSVGLYDQLWDEVIRNRPKEDDDDDGFLF